MAQRWFDALLPIIGPPTLPAVTIASDGGDPAVARIDETLTVTFTANKPVQTPTVVIAGRSATVANVSGNTWSAAITVTAADPAGPVAFQITYADLGARAGTPATTTTDASAAVIAQPTVYELWSAASGLHGAAALLDADPDGDGLANVAEFAYGLDPAVSYSGMIELNGGTITAYGIPRLVISNTPDGVSIRVFFGRRKDRALAGLSYTVQFSADLSTWANNTALTTPLAEDATMEAVSVPMPFFVSGRKARFFRVVVALP